MKQTVIKPFAISQAWRAADFKDVDDFTIFLTIKRNVSAFYVREVLQIAADEFGVPLTEKEVAALDKFDNCARANAFQFRLEQSDALFMNNRTTLQARTKCKNGSDDARKRHLMRLWLDVPGMRPDVPKIQLYENDNGCNGLDPQIGRVHAAVHYRKVPNASAQHHPFGNHPRQVPDNPKQSL